MKLSYVIAIVAVIIIGLGVWGYESTHAHNSKYIPFAECIAASGTKFYGAFWCPHCAAEKQLFGDAVNYLPYVECSTPDGQSQDAICNQMGITGYPTWIFPDGTRVTGVQTLQALADKTSCTLPN